MMLLPTVVLKEPVAFVLVVLIATSILIGFGALWEIARMRREVELLRDALVQMRSETNTLVQWLYRTSVRRP